LLHDPTDPNNLDRLALEAMAGYMVVVAGASNPAELEAAVALLIRERVEVVMLATTALSFNFRKRIIDAALRAGIPVVGHRSVLVDDGALFAYSTSLAEQLRASAGQVDKILKGAKPADLPVEQPTTFELVINRSTASILGLKFPNTVLVRADRVVE
jgi:putative ABC transport system substrate-binding protein